MRTFLKTDNGRDVYLTALVYDDNADDATLYTGVAQFSLEDSEGGSQIITKSFEIPKTSIVEAATLSYDSE